MNQITERKERIEQLKKKIWASSPISLKRLCNEFSIESGVSVETVMKYINLLIQVGQIKINDGIISFSHK